MARHGYHVLCPARQKALQRGHRSSHIVVKQPVRCEVGLVFVEAKDETKVDGLCDFIGATRLPGVKESQRWVAKTL